MSEAQAANVVTSENLAEWTMNRLGLADKEPEVVAEVEETPSEPIDEPDQSEQDDADQEATAKEERKQNPKLEKRFSELTKQREALRKEADAERKRAEGLEERIKALEGNPAPKQAEITNEKPRPDQFTDAFEYAEALADWSTEQALLRRDQEESQKKFQEQRDKVLKTWNDRLETAKKELPDYDDMVTSSDVVVSDQVRDAIIESEIGPQILYHLAENPDIAEKLKELSPISALREIGKLEARLEKQAEKQPETKRSEPIAVKSKAPAPLSPLRGTGSVADVKLDSEGNFYGSYQAYKEARKAGRIR